MTESDTERRSLLQRVASLEEENALLKRRIGFLEGMPVLVQGIKGETIISQLIGGTMTPHIAPHDVDGPGGTQIEVKFSRLTTPVPGCRTRRWNWCYPLGARHTKSYDRLILVGEADPRFAEHYMEPESPYVLFDVPLADVPALLLKENMIQITTDPTNRRAGRRRVLFEKYQVTAAILADRYGLT